MIADTEGFKLTVLLCDSAQSVGGKLYVLGGGWSRVLSVGQPISMALAIYVAVPWLLANEPLDLVVRLLDANNQPVAVPGQPGTVEVRGRLEVGRPVGLARGTPLDASFALNFALPLNPGIYLWESSIVSHISDTTRFEVIRAQAAPGHPS